MASVLPIAIVSGIDRPGAGELVQRLKNNDIDVIEIGEFTGKISDVKESATYIFDFDNNGEVWSKAREDGARLTVVQINRKAKEPERKISEGVNWRIVAVRGVFGRGLVAEEEKEVWFLNEAVKLAVRNKNLILPARSEKLRLLSEEEVAEAVMRTTFLSGTEGGVYEIWGRVITAETIAEILIDEAKMTRFKVEENPKFVEFNRPCQYEDEAVEGVWKMLRWRPGEDLRPGIRKLLQKYFEEFDAEKRKKVTSNEKQEARIEPAYAKATAGEARIKPEKRYEVGIEPDLAKDLSNEGDMTIEEVETGIIHEQTQELSNKKQDSKIMEEAADADSYGEPREIKPFLGKKYKEMETGNKKLEVGIKQEQVQELSNKKQEEKVREEETLKKISWVKKIKNKIQPKKEIMVSFNWRVMASLLVWVAAVGAGVTLMVGIMFGTGNYLMVKKVMSVEKLLTERKFDQAGEALADVKKMAEDREQFLDTMGGRNWIWGRRYNEILKLTEEGAAFGETVIRASRILEELNKGIFDDKNIDWDKEMEKLTTEISNGQTELGMMLARLAGDWGWVPYRWRGSMVDLRWKVAEMKDVLNKGETVVKVLPELIGTEGKRREYMVLLQNESELRAGGGFVGSYGILTFERGKLINFEIKDVYEADGQLKGHVEPPAEIKTYLGEAKWYMRDANWQADFTGSTREIQWFLEKETGRKVDGVIGVNLAVAKGILGVTGDVYVPDFKEKINKNNLYEQAEFYSETKFFPGSNQKASFLGTLGKQLFEEIKTAKVEERWKLLAMVLKLLEENEIQLAMNNKQVAKIFNEKGWSGAIYSVRCPQESGKVEVCLADYLYLVESNLGVNKANYFLYRNIDLAIDVGPRALARVLKISYENTAKTQAWPAGDYKNYMRVYIPQSAAVAEVSIRDPQTNSKMVITEPNLKTSMTAGKKEIGFLVQVPIGQKRIVEIRYNDQIDLTGASRFNYLGYIQKQSGYGDTGMVTLMTPPTGWMVSFAEPEGSVNEGKLLFNQKFNKDIKFNIEITK